jgi:hypothetical protein
MKFLATIPKALAVGLFLAAVGLVFPFGHLYLLNAVNFTLPLAAHLPDLALAGMATVLAATILQLAVPVRARTGVRTGLLLLGIFVWAETTLFLGDFGFFVDGKLDWEANRHLLYLELLLAALLVLAAVRGRTILERRAGLIMVVLTVSAAANLHGPWRTEVSRTRQDVEHTFTRQGVFDLSPERNVLIFILDTYQADVFADIVADDPSWRTVFDGFTYFPDAVSAFPKTYASIPNMLTGTAFDNGRPYPDYMREAYLGNSLPRLLKDSGFDVRYHAIVWQPYLAHPDVADNLAGFDSHDQVRWLRDKEAVQLANLVMFRAAPFALKRWVFDDGRFRLRARPAPEPENLDVPILTGEQRHYSVDNDHEDLAFLDEFLTFADTGSDRPACRIYHLGGPHAPFQLDPALNYVGTQDYAPGPFRDQSEAGLALMEKVFERLRSVGAYDNSLIIIVGDHGNGELGSLDIRTDALARLSGGTEPATSDDPEMLEIIRGSLPLVLAKPFETQGPLRVSTAPVELGDVAATVVQEANLDGTLPGRSLFDQDFDPHRKRLHRFYRFAGWGQDFIVPLTEWVVDGFSWDPGSWSPSGRDLNRAAAASVRGDLVFLGASGNLDDFPHAGWSEPAAEGRSIEGDSASIVFEVPEDPGSSAILVTLRQLSPGPAVPMRIYTDTDLAAIVEVGGMAPIRHRILLPDGWLTPGAPVEVRLLPEGGRAEGTQFLEVRLDYHAERPVWPLGSKVVFSRTGRGHEYQNYGWALADEDATWTRGNRSTLAFTLDREPENDLEVRAVVFPARFEGSPPVRARILAGGTVVHELELAVQEYSEIAFTIPRDLIAGNRHLDLEFRVENPRSPREYDVNPDPRQLGIWLQSLSISEAKAVE